MDRLSMVIGCAFRAPSCGYHSTLVNNTTSGTTMYHVPGADCLLRDNTKY